MIKINMIEEAVNKIMNKNNQEEEEEEEKVGKTMKMVTKMKINNFKIISDSNTIIKSPKIDFLLILFYVY